MTANDLQQLSTLICRNQVLQKLQKVAIEQSVDMLLVGGAVRDLLLGKELWDHDLDFELHFKNITSIQATMTLFTQALQQVFPQGEFEHLPFSILRLIVGNQQVEFSLPREEFFIADHKCLKHSDFKVSIMTNCTVAESFKRRDFTCNAMAILINDLPTVTLVDPFEGQQSILQSELRHCSQQCFYDPVRFVRLVRFSLSLNFSIHPDLQKNLGAFCLQHLTIFYLITEMNKSRQPAKFVQLFFELIDKYGIEYNDQLEFFRPWGKIEVTALNAQQLFVLDLLATPEKQDVRIQAFFTYAHWLNLKKRFVSRVIQIKQKFNVNDCNLKEKVVTQTEIVEILNLLY